MAAVLQLYILCYNRAPLARQAIQSALRQTAPFHLVISDNSTDDETQAMVAAEFSQLDYCRRVPSLKALDHFNLCIDEATAPYICLFHDDDLLDPHYVERMLAAIAARPDAVAFGTNAWIAEDGRPLRLSFDTRGEMHAVRDARQLASHYFGRYQMGIAPFPGYVYARAHLSGLRFDAAGGKYSDVSWLLRVVARGPMVWLTAPLMTYRLHASNDSRSESIGDRLRLLAYFKRHEAAIGAQVIEDFRFFVYKKALALEHAQSHALPPARRHTMKNYLKRYRCRRVVRGDQHLALLRRTAVRLARRFSKPAGEMATGAR
ncbi:MAG: glycosyltransferase family 2 protein [Rhizobacter sp.]